MWCSFVNCAWCTMVGATNNANLPNSTKVKLVKVLNNFGVVHIVANTSQIPTPKSTKWHVPSFNSLVVNMSNELATTIAVAKAHYFYLSMFVNISCIPLSLENEKLKLFDPKVLVWPNSGSPHSVSSTCCWTWFFCNRHWFWMRIPLHYFRDAWRLYLKDHGGWIVRE